MKANNELVYRGILCKQVDSKVWKIVIGQSEYLYPTFADAKTAINTLHEDCIKTCCGTHVVNDSGTKRKKKGHPVLIAFVVCLIIFFIGSGSSSNNAPKATKAPTPTASVTTAAPPSTAEETVFAVEHDEEYYATQDYIYKSLTEKGYEVQVIIGVPNIGRIEDNDPDDLTVPWYAYVKHKGEWVEFIVLLFNGEVSFIRPNK